MESIEKSTSNANILEGLRLSGGSANNQSGKDEITNWLKELDIIN